MVVMKDSFEQGLRMLSDMARHPAFAPAEIDRQRQQTLSGLQVSLEDPEYIANAVFDRLVYGFHPYGMPETGTPETIAATDARRSRGVSRAVLRAEQRHPRDRRRRHRGGSFAAARKVFGDWERRDVTTEKYHRAARADAARGRSSTSRMRCRPKCGSAISAFRATIPDYMAVNLAIRILGGEGSNRLHQVLRTERGLTYGAQANMDTLKESGDFEAETNTRSDATGEVLRLIVDEFWRLQRERVGEGELATPRPI